MKSIYVSGKILVLSALLFFLFSCKDEHFAKFEDPPWLGGSIIETLKEKGNYEILLTLMDKSGYTEPIEKGLYTLFAANDSAYMAYFKSKGISSVDEVSEDQAFKLFTLNVLNTPRARQQLIFDYSYWHGGWQEPHSELGALLFRINTISKSNDYVDYVKYYKSFKDQSLKITGQEKMVPLLSTEFFADFNGAADGSDYTFFFPNTEWTGLQWYNATVLDNAKCSNGYVYFLDKAVPEIPNIEDYLRENQDRFGVYYDLIQRFAVYSFSEYDTDPDRTKLYAKHYDKISDLTSEVGPVTDAMYKRKTTYSLYVPKDDVFRDYINNTFLKNFESLDSIPEITLVFLAQSCIKNSFDIASKIQRSFVNNYGDEIPIDVYNDVDEAILLSNGPVYVMNKYYPPRAFSSTISPVFFDNIYTTFLYGMNDAQMVSSVTSSDLEITIFAPTNEGLLEGGIRYYVPRKTLEIQEEDGTWSTMDFDQKKAFVSDHVLNNASGEQVDFSGEGFVKMSSGNYIYYNSNTIQGGGNQELGNVAKIIDTQQGDNGKFYALDKAILAPKNDPAKFISKDDDLSEFYNLLFEAGLADSAVDATTNIPYARISFLQEHDFWTVLAPTNAAIDEARNNAQIPDSLDALKQFVRYHFISDDVFFDDGKINGTFSTARIDSVGVKSTYYTPIEVKNVKNNLSVVDQSGNNVKVPHSKADNLVLLGVLHKIDKVLLDQ